MKQACFNRYDKEHTNGHVRFPFGLIRTSYLRMKYRLFLPFISATILLSCTAEQKNTSDTSQNFENDSAQVKIKYAETSFIVPSPNQTTILLKKCNVGFNHKFTSPVIQLEKYTTTAKKSLALGIFGADLSYLNLYEQRETAAKFVHHVESLMNELEISHSLDKKILKKIEQHFGNNDSVLHYLSELYRTGDLYLKAEDRRDICSLIVAGGWIESFYFLTELYAATHKEEIFNLILYQSDILDGLIKILSPYYTKSPEFTLLIDDLVNIAYEFDVVDRIHAPATSITDSLKKETIVHNKTTYLLSGSKLDNLAKYASDLRNKII